MSTKSIPSPELLRKLLRYEPLTGKLFWLVRGVEWFKDGYWTAEANCNRWNACFANKEAFTAYTNCGYKHGYVLNKKNQAHRVIWAIVTGAWPVDQIDHEDHDRANNRWVNLKEVTHQENGKNTSMQKNNTRGFTGVSWRKKSDKWVATIRFNGKQQWLGEFADKSDAIIARKAANTKYEYHANHGITL